MSWIEPANHTSVFSKARRTSLIGFMLVLIFLLLIALVWLVGRYEQSLFEDQLELSANAMTSNIRLKLTQRAEQVNELRSHTLQDPWTGSASVRAWLTRYPEILRIEQRDIRLDTQAALKSPLQHNEIYSNYSRENYRAEVQQACLLATKSMSPAFSAPFYVPQGTGKGMNLLDLCIARRAGDTLIGFTVLTFSLDSILEQWASSASPVGLSRAGQQDVLLLEADGSRLAAKGASKRRGDKFTAQSLLDLPGVTLILRLETWVTAPFWLANAPTAIVLVMALALGIVLWLLYRDTRKRLKTEAEYRLSQERLQRSARLASLGEMASMLSHELNQPLAAIASYATGSLNLLETEPHALDIYEIKMALERIEKQSQRAGQIIKSVNDFVRRREAERGPTEPSVLFEAILPLLTMQARQHGIKLVVQAAPDLPQVWCDKILIEQVLINLARNGMQAIQSLSDSTGEKILKMAAIAHRASQESLSDSVYFYVEDTGSGISPAIESQLFTPFFTTKEEGTGLGLSLCRTVVEQHGSNLTYTSKEGEDSGTRFGFHLKIYTENLAT